MSSNKPRPRFQIPSHVFAFTLASIPGVVYAIYWKRNHQSDEEFEKTLQQNYAHKIQGSRDKRQDMVQFFNALKNPDSNPDQEEKFKMLLQGGRGEIKRQHAVDEALYGKEEGIKKKKEVTADNDTSEHHGGSEDSIDSRGDSTVSTDGKNCEHKDGNGEKIKRKLARKKKYKKNANDHEKDTTANSINSSRNDSEDGHSPQRRGSVAPVNIPSIRQAAVGTVVVGTLAVVASSLMGTAKRGG